MSFKSTLSLLGLLAGLPVAARAAESATNVEFVENKGQWDARARYAAPIGPGARLFAEARGLTYTFTAGLPDHEPQGKEKPGTAAPSDQLPAHALRVEFVNASASAALTGESEALSPRHYLRGSEPARWAAGARSWQQLRYRELWPGTDLLLKENAEHQLEYDLLLAAGADPGRVRLRYSGADALQLDPLTGRLLVKTSVGLLTEHQPRAWQLNPATGARQPVACAFQLKGSEVSFRLGTYDHRRPLIIDPVVQFASYSGSTVENWGFTATSDAAGSLYTAGVVFEPGYPVSTGAYQTSFSGSTDIVVMKFITTVTGPGARAWATHLGGNNLEFPHSLLVNGRGELLLLGTTSSTNYPTTAGAVSTRFHGGPSIAPFGASSQFVLPNGADLVLSRLSAGGGQLRASTYLGGTDTDGLLDPLAAQPRLRHNYGDAFRGDLALDAQGNVYLASTTSSLDFPGVMVGAYRGGTSDGLVTSLDSSLSRVRWTTLLGGSRADAAYSLQREEATGTLFVAGGTGSPNLSGAAGGFLPNLLGGVDGYVARLSAAGAITQTTYLGTGAYDQAFFVRLGPGGGPVVLGQSLGTYPTTAGVFSNANGRQFIQQLAPDLLSGGYSTVFGSGRAQADISPTAFEVDCFGRIFLTGWGGGLDPNGGFTFGLPVTPNALQSWTDGQDFYLMQLSDGARVLDYATYFGTSADDHVDGGMSRFDPQGTLYQALCACNQGGIGIPIPAGAHYYSSVNGSSHCNNAAFKFATVAGATPAGPDTLSVCSRVGSIALGGSPAGGSWTGQGVMGSVTSGFFFQPDTTRLGPHVLTYTSPLTGLCAGTSTRTINVLPQARARLTAPVTSFCLQPQGPPPALVPLTASPAGGTLTGVGIVPGTNMFDPVLAGPGVHGIRYQVGSGRCLAFALITMVVKGRRIITVDPPRQVCANDPPFPLGGSPPGGTWTGPGVSGSIALGFSFSPSPALVGTNLLRYTFTGTPDCLPPTDTMRVIVLPVAGSVQVPADTSICPSRSGPFRLLGGLPAGGTWTGAGVTGTAATGFTFTPTAGMLGSVGLTYIGPRPNPNECPGRATRRVLLSTNQAGIYVPDTLLCPSAGPMPLLANPAGGSWTGPGVTGSVAAGFFFDPRAALVGRHVLTYLGPTPADPNQCPASGQLRLRVLAAPTVAFDAVPPVSFCAAAPPHGVVLNAQPAGGLFVGPGVSSNRFNPAQAGPGVHTLYYFYREPLRNCETVVTRTVTVSLVPPIRLPADTVLCADQKPFQLQASPAGGSWGGAGVTPAGLFTPPAAPGTVVLHYSLPDGCGTQPYRVTVPAEPTFAARWTAPGCADNRLAPRYLRFEASGPQAGQVQWDFGDGSATASGASAEHVYNSPGRYLVQASLPGPAGSGPCRRQLTLLPVDVQEGKVPNVFTPNGDGLNETFAPEVGGCPGRLQVYSRWGQRVLDQPNYRNDWAGQGLPAGIYYYLLSLPDSPVRIKGWVEIVR